MNKDKCIAQLLALIDRHREGEEISAPLDAVKTEHGRERVEFMLSEIARIHGVSLDAM